MFLFCFCVPDKRPTSQTLTNNADNIDNSPTTTQSLEKAMVDMDADLKARAEEHQLSLKLREQWQQKMRVSVESLAQVELEAGVGAVSYTHLTLPTKA